MVLLLYNYGLIDVYSLSMDVAINHIDHPTGVHIWRSHLFSAFGVPFQWRPTEIPSAELSRSSPRRSPGDELQKLRRGDVTEKLASEWRFPLKVPLFLKERPQITMLSLSPI